MKQLTLITIAAMGSLLLDGFSPLAGAQVIPSSPGLKICVAADAPPDVKQCANDILAAVSTSPLLTLLAGDKGASLADSASILTDKSLDRAYNHLILVGLPTDPMIQAAWQHEARVEEGGLYVFDFGHLRGNIGYIESDRNPFLHSPLVGVAPFEAETITVTGSNPAGVRLAASSLLKNGLVAGVVTDAGWKRSSQTILDHAPLLDGWMLSAPAPAKAGDATRIGVIQAGESDYRGVFQDAGVTPKEIWRFKYAVPDQWKASGAVAARANYLAGLHRRAFGNTLWLAKFSSPAEAEQAAPKIAQAAALQQKGQVWSGSQADGAGPLTLWQHQEWLVMSTLAEMTSDTDLSKN